MHCGTGSTRISFVPVFECEKFILIPRKIRKKEVEGSQNAPLSKRTLGDLPSPFAWTSPSPTSSFFAEDTTLTLSFRTIPVVSYDGV